MATTNQAGRHRGQQNKHEDKVSRECTLGVRLTKDEYQRLEAQSRLDGRSMSEILRDWFIGAPDPKLLPYQRRMGTIELANYRRLLNLIQEVWKLRAQFSQLPLPAVQQLAEEVLQQLLRLADVLVPAAGEPLDEPFTAFTGYDNGQVDDGEDGMFFADTPYWRQRNGEPFPADAL